jgi:hypothetical protein
MFNYYTHFVTLSLSHSISYSIIYDPDSRLVMYKWLLQATKARPPIKANDFSKFVGQCYRNTITDKTSRLWMHELGFSFSTADMLQLYHDGQQREDVLRALKDYVFDMLTLRTSGQPDFAAQKNGLEEAFEKYNNEHGTLHSCHFLPKFHPELNPIERVWGRMKWYVRQWVDGTMVTLAKLMREGLSYPDDDGIAMTNNLSLAIVRKYVRLTWAYILAYNEGHDLLSADEWLKQRRSHRGYAPTMDDKLEALYFPLGRRVLVPNMAVNVDDLSPNEILPDDDAGNLVLAGVMRDLAIDEDNDDRNDDDNFCVDDDDEEEEAGDEE